VQNTEGVDSLTRDDMKMIFDPLSLTESGRDYIIKTYGSIQLDLFSSRANNIFQVEFCSNHYDEGKQNLNIDGLSYLVNEDYSGKRVWIFPPFSLINAVIELLLDSKAHNWILDW